MHNGALRFNPFPKSCQNKLMFESFLQTPQPPEEVNKQTNTKCTGAKPLCPEGFKNSCTCSKASPAASQELAPLPLQTLHCAVGTTDAAQMLGEQERQQTQSLCGWWLPGTSILASLPPPESLTGMGRCSGSEVCGCRELAWKNREVGCEPAAPGSAQHISRSRISPGWSYSCC